MQERGAAGRQQGVEISVVLAVFNEAGHLRTELDRIHDGLRAGGRTYEVIVVDDGSTDGSTELLRQRDDIHFIPIAQNRGCGHARRIGTETASGQVVVWTDVDMTYPNERIAWLVDQLDDGWDQVVGVRTTEQGDHRVLRLPTKWVIGRVASHLFRERIPDLNSGFRAFRRDVGHLYLHLLPPGFSCVTTITLAFVANAHPVRYLPIEYRPRAGASKFHWRRDTSRYVLQVLRMAMMFDPMRVVGSVAGLLVVLAGARSAFNSLARR